jgi:predicted nucleic-acid-binding Zn-ribbon protein
MRCPKCGSDHTRTFSVVYEEGTVHGTSSGYVDGYSATSNSFSQSPLASKCSPPYIESAGCFAKLCALVIAVIVTILFNKYFGADKAGASISFVLITFFGALFVIGVIWQMLVGLPREEKYKKQLALWESSWVCIKCGNTFLAE